MTDQTVSSWRRRLGHPRGRDLSPVALVTLRALLGDERQQPSLRQRDQLLEHLHAIQDAHGHLSMVELRALATYMNLPMAAVYETATFYAHFDVVHDGQTPPPDTTVRVCDSLSCQLAGAAQLKAKLEKGLDPETVRVLRAPCMGRCDSAPVVEVGHHHVQFATAEGVEAVVDTGHFQPEAIIWQRLEAYQQAGGYQLLADCRGGGASALTHLWRRWTKQA
ncbi:NAD(P)H-dependent oxidoreductase subunit E [Halomonas sp. QHL1]|uniref:NADH-quinone oxidoreductase subunit NuoE family protein n=1 Tax=Halomonas sp. QHL1 TaxID=1123773 RepID=UPI0020C855DC|nr:NAD(P)H-dependent oxidoreductase subunit E [Halomonas sp. QHL1]